MLRRIEIESENLAKIVLSLAVAQQRKELSLGMVREFFMPYCKKDPHQPFSPLIIEAAEAEVLGHYEELWHHILLVLGVSAEQLIIPRVTLPEHHSARGIQIEWQSIGEDDVVYQHCKLRIMQVLGFFKSEMPQLG